MKNNNSNLTNYLLCSYILEQQKKETEHATKLALSGGIIYVPGSDQKKCIYLPKTTGVFQETMYLSRSCR
jgi:hypothetical protein